MKEMIMSYKGSELLGEKMASRAIGYLINRIVGKRICVEGQEPPTDEMIEEAIKRSAKIG